MSSAPDIDRLIEKTRQTPFTNRIVYARLRDVRKLKFHEYAGNTDPRAHLSFQACNNLGLLN